MRDVLALLMAGLGIFCVGLHLVSTGLQESTSRTVRSLIRQWTATLPARAAAGILAGAVLQSTSAVATILGSMATSGLVDLEQALPIVAFANVGTTALVFAGAIDLRVAVMFAVGIAGLGFSFVTEFRWRAVATVVLGVALLLYGNNLVTAASSGVEQSNWFSGFLQWHAESTIMAFGLGTAASFVMQSTIAAALMSIALANAGLLNLGEATVMVYGANLGSTLMRMLLTNRRAGIPRQVSGFQDLFKIAGVVIFCALFAVEQLTSLPLVAALAVRLADGLALQLAVINLVFNGSMAVLATTFGRPVGRVVRRWWPPTSAETLSVPAYVSHEAARDPESAIDLLEKEQMRVIERTRDYLTGDGSEAARETKVDRAELHRSFSLLFRELEHFHVELVGKSMESGTSERLGNVHGRQKLLELVEDSVHQLTTSVREAPATRKLEALTSNVAEALDFLLMCAVEAARTLDREPAELLFNLSSDRSDMMSGIRGLYLAPDLALAADEKTLLLRLTNLFERTVWMLQRYAELLVRNVAQSDARGWGNLP